MRLLLVAPDRKASPEEPANKLRLHLRSAFPPLSLLHVAALTPPEFEVELQDEAIQQIDFDRAFDLVGITANTACVERAYELAARFRSLGRLVVIGGIHATALPEEARRQADAVVAGEAEGSWQRLLGDFRQGRLRPAAEGELAPIYRCERWPDLSNLPAPRRELLQRGRYLVPNTVQGTRGCVHDCAFCSVTTFYGREMRSRPAECVAREVGALAGRVVVFVDDNILARPSYARSLFERLRGLGKTWWGQASLSTLGNLDLLRLAAKSGCRGLFVGLESLSAVALKKMGKSFNLVERFKESIKRLHDLGIGVVGAFMFGFDEDDEGVFERTAKFVEGAKIDLPQYSILTPLPGTRVMGQMEGEGRILDRNWAHYDGGHVVFRPARMSPEKLEAGLKWALRCSYSWRGIFQRLLGFSPRLPAMAAANLAFRRRALPYARGPIACAGPARP
jgi:radical SAM superfamily enzyme YgiQ (UPF0313 family)